MCIILTLALFGLHWAFSSALTEYQMLVVFNGGNTATGMTCSSESDWALVMQAMGGGRRNALEGSDPASDQGMEEETDGTHLRRRLAGYLYPAACKSTCGSFAPRTCTAPGCKGYRRGLAAAPEDESTNGRDLQSTGWCRLAYESVVSKLNALKTNPSVSAACKNLLNQPRQLTCVVVNC